MRRLYRAIMAELLREVVAGELPAAGRLLSEQEIAARFACSRSVAREAIRALEERRIVEVEAGHGQLVLQEDRWNLLDADVAHAVLVQQREPDLLRDALEAARVVETQAAMLAAGRARGGDLDLLAASLERMRRASGGGNGSADSDGAFAAAEAAFHRTLMLVSGNRFLAAMVETLHPVLATARREQGSDRDALVIRLHERIVAALRARDPTAAAAAIDGYARHVASWLRV